MTNIENDNLFLNLLTEKNLKRIKIDSELIPTFKIVIAKINDFFSENGLMNVKDWNSFFEEFLISDNPDQLCIKLGRLDNVSHGGEYSKINKEIVMNIDDTSPNGISKGICHDFCHEFIHFLVMHDSNSLNAKISDSMFFNEGMTEYLTGCIMGTGNNSFYYREYKMAEFYCKITKNPFAYFLNDKFAFEDDYYAPMNLIRSSDKFQNDNKLDSYLSIQREIINNGIDDCSINSFEDFANIVTIINQRPRYDGEYINYIFERISNKYLEKMNLDEQQKNNIKDKLITFCKVSNKYQLYDDNEVAEYLIDDLHIGFDKKGKHYNDFPLNGTSKRGQIGFDGVSKITVTHRDKTYVINTEKMNCKNWKEFYDKAYNDLEKEIDLLTMQTIENNESKTSFKR